MRRCTSTPWASGASTATNALTVRELEAIRHLVGEALQAGAVGVSTLRTRMHRGADGRLIPTYRASDAELMASAAGMCDGRARHLRDRLGLQRRHPRRGVRPLSGICPPVRAAGSCSPAPGPRALPKRGGRDGANLRGPAREGLAFSAQTAVRPVGVAMGLDSRAHLFSRCPSYQQIGQLPLADRVARCVDPAIKDRILSEAGSAAPGSNLGRLFAMRAPIDYEPDAATSIAARGRGGQC